MPNLWPGRNRESHTLHPSSLTRYLLTQKDQQNTWMCLNSTPHQLDNASGAGKILQG